MIALLALIALAPQAEQVSYERDIAPLFAARCVECHGAEKRRRAGASTLPRPCSRGATTGSSP